MPRPAPILFRLEALLLSTQQSHSRNAKSQEAETQKRVSLALQVCNGLRSDLRQAQLDNEQFQAKARQKCHLMTLACDKRDEVMLRLRKSLRDERQSKASGVPLMCPERPRPRAPIDDCSGICRRLRW